MTERLVQEVDVDIPRLNHRLLVLQHTELVVEHRDEDQETDGAAGDVQLGEGLKELDKPGHFLLDVLIKEGDDVAESDVGWRGSRPGDGVGLG